MLEVPSPDRRNPNVISNLRFSDNYYKYGTVILNTSEIKELLKNGTLEELRRVIKINKEI